MKLLPPKRERVPGPELSPETLRRIDILFVPADREAGETLLYEQCGSDLYYQGGTEREFKETERLRIAALKVSDGRLVVLEHAVKLAQKDFRDLLVWAGFANEVDAHLKWQPKPAGEPSEIDPPALATAIHEALASILLPLGFTRNGDEWRREGEIPQTLSLITGSTTRVEVRFFMKVTIQADKLIVMRLPKPPKRFEDLNEQGYIFRAGGNQEALCARVSEDVILHALPLFQRFISRELVEQGFEDGTFKKHLPVQGQIWLL
jgi:hypothetical protein